MSSLKYLIYRLGEPRLKQTHPSSGAVFMRCSRSAGPDIPTPRAKAGNSLAQVLSDDLARGRIDLLNVLAGSRVHSELIGKPRIIEMLVDLIDQRLRVGTRRNRAFCIARCCSADAAVPAVAAVAVAPLPFCGNLLPPDA